MKCFDFVVNEVHELRIRELDTKAQGRKVIGSYCVFAPVEQQIVGAIGKDFWAVSWANKKSQK
jgi:hypothetical protein